MRQMQPPAPPHCSALEGTLHPVPGSVHSDGGAGNSHIPECSLALRGIRYMTALSWGVPSPPLSGGRCDPLRGSLAAPHSRGSCWPCPRSHPTHWCQAQVWSLSAQVGTGSPGKHLPPAARHRDIIPCPWLVPHCRGAPRLQAGRREGRTDEGWTEGKED